jgi:UDP-GlcNAc3NAcA epimerase
MRIVSVVGARPQFVKLAPVSRAIEECGGLEHHIIHTGQHYDDAMSAAFFHDLSLPEPTYNLEVGSGTHAVQTAEMMRRLEPVLKDEHPDWVLLYGDTNSTAAGAMTGAKLHIPLAHIEAGLRSFNRRMPEEINRIVADHLSDLLFCPTTTGMENLRREGLEARAVVCGDVMYDAVLANIDVAENRSDSAAYRWPLRGYALATIHRAENTDSPARLSSLIASLEHIALDICPVVLAIHPRTRNACETNGITLNRVSTLSPLPYRDMLLFEKRARVILTDSGGVQKEAYLFHVPCVTLREETEWTETLENGCNILAGSTDTGRIVSAVRRGSSAGPWRAPYGRGGAARIIIQSLKRTGAATHHDSVADREEQRKVYERCDHS